MSQNINHDYICSCLDESTRVMGLTLDEFIPLFLIFVIGMLTNSFVLSFIGMMIMYAVMKRLKKGQGASILLILLYKNTYGSLSKTLFKEFPEPTKRLWW